MDTTKSKKKGIKTDTEIRIIRLIEENNNDNVIPLRVSLVDICHGDLEAGIMLGQLIYWNDRGNHQNEGYIYKSATDWYKETRLSDFEVKSRTKLLKELGFIETKNAVAVGHNTRFYKLNIDKVIIALDNLFLDIKPLAATSNAEPICESSEESNQEFNDLENSVDAEIFPLDVASSELDVASNYTETIRDYTETTFYENKDSTIIEASSEASQSLDDSLKQDNINYVYAMINTLFPEPEAESASNGENLFTSAITDSSSCKAVSALFNRGEYENLLPETKNQKRFLEKTFRKEFEDLEDKNLFQKIEKLTGEDSLRMFIGVSISTNYKKLMYELEDLNEFFRY